MRLSALVTMLGFVTLLTTALHADPKPVLRKCENIVVVTIDGLRLQEVFGGFDESLIEAKDSHKYTEFNADSPEERRQKLLPFMWSTVASAGAILGNPEDESQVLVTNPHHFSYPGYNELLTGINDPKIDSNAKRPNENVTVLEWLHSKPEFKNKVYAFGSWDVFPSIINDTRSGIPVNAGWVPLASTIDTPATRLADRLATQIPHTFDTVRYDAFTMVGATECLRVNKPRVLYVALGEPDDWAHKGDYLTYLKTSRAFDRSLKELWEMVEADPHYSGRTAMIIGCDHGRGDTRESWKNHNKQIPGSDHTWMAMFGPSVTPPASMAGRFTQSQFASTIAQMLGYDFCEASEKSAQPISFDSQR